MSAPAPQPAGVKARERLIFASACTMAHAIEISNAIGDGHDNMMVFLQEVNRLEYPTSDERPAGVIVGPEENSADDVASLEPEAIERLQNLLGEIANMHLAIKHLSDHEDSESTCYAVSALQTGMGDRIERSVNLVYGSREQGN